MINIPHGARVIIELLESSGYEAYVVGGCVRDSLMGIKPHDWDICTSASPEQIKVSLRFFRIIETGIKHGTVTVLSDDGCSYEVTTYRTDGDYTDNRHPDKVTYVKDLVQDLKRRDFTMNAIAYSPKRGLVDPFDGKRAIDNKIVYCVGEARDRFNEDALRIMRALRFSSVLGFEIARNTSDMIHFSKGLLKNISSERINSELCKLLMGHNALDIMLNYSDVIRTIIPEFDDCIGYEQNNVHHIYNVYEHIVRSVSEYQGSDISVKLALLFHDIGKPQCYSADSSGVHFYGNAVRSSIIADKVLRRLRFDNSTIDEVLKLVLNHTKKIDLTKAAVRKCLNQIGLKNFIQLIEVQRADARAKAEDHSKTAQGHYKEIMSILKEIEDCNDCYELKDLAVNGNDIISLGVSQGKEVGNILSALLESVINGQIENTRRALMEKAFLLKNERTQYKNSKE